MTTPHLSKERIAEIGQYLACRPPYGTIRFADESLEAMLAERAADVALDKRLVQTPCEVPGCCMGNPCDRCKVVMEMRAALKQKGEL